MRCIIGSNLNISIKIIISVSFFFSIDNLGSRELLSVHDLPPEEVLEASYHSAQCVLCMDIHHVNLTDTLFTDSGAPGYVRLRYDGRILEIFKGNLSDTTICVTNWIEYDDKMIDYMQNLVKIIVFTREVPDGNECHPVMESGLFAASDSLVQFIRQLN